MAYTHTHTSDMDIASRLDEAMKAARIPSQSALSRASGIPQPTINRILKGVGAKGPEAHTLVKLAAACNVSFDWLHEGKGRRERVDAAADHAPGESQDTHIERIDHSEKELLEAYRMMSQDNRARLLDAVGKIPKAGLPARSRHQD